MELKLGQTVYRTGRLSALTQLHVTKRLTPIIGELGPLAKAKQAGATGDDLDVDTLLVMLANIASVLPDESLDYIINACLDVAERQQGNAWAKVRRDGLLMFEDIGLPAMLQITWHTIKDNLSDFFGDPAFSGLAGIIRKYMPTI